MKSLFLLRHAKSSWDDPALSDFQRPLSPRGRESAPNMGREMTRRNWHPDRILVSSAVRTRETWDLAARETPALPKARFLKKLYAAPAKLLLAELRKVPEEAGCILLVGHNPGIEDLARSLASSGSDESSIERLRKKFPTAALARFDFDGRWAELGAGTARLTDFLRPKDLG